MRKAVAPVIATLLLVAIAVVGGAIIFVLSQGFFSSAPITEEKYIQWNETKTIDIVWEFTQALSSLDGDGKTSFRINGCTVNMARVQPELFSIVATDENDGCSPETRESIMKVWDDFDKSQYYELVILEAYNAPLEIFTEKTGQIIGIVVKQQGEEIELFNGDKFKLRGLDEDVVAKKIVIQPIREYSGICTLIALHFSNQTYFMNDDERSKYGFWYQEDKDVKYVDLDTLLDLEERYYVKHYNYQECGSSRIKEYQFSSSESIDSIITIPKEIVK